MGLNVGNMIGRKECECETNCRCLCHRKVNGEQVANHIVPCCGPGSGRHEMCKREKEKDSTLVKI